MVASTVTILSPPSGIDLPDGTDGIKRPRADVAWTGGTGPFNVKYEWDTANTFDTGNLITQTNTSVTSPDTELPLSDLGGQTWYLRATVIDTGDSNAELASAIHTLDYTDPKEQDRFLYLRANVIAAFDAKDSPTEIQLIYNDASSGTFTLSFDGQGPTSSLNYNATAAQIKTALEGLSNITEVKVTELNDNVIRGITNAWRVEFIDPGGESEPLITATDTLTGGSTSIKQWRDGDDWDVASPSAGTVGTDGQNDPSTLAQFLTLPVNVTAGFNADISPLGDDPLEVQCVYNDATGGTFTLSFDGQGPTGAIAYNATAAAVKSALELLSNITEVRVFDNVVPGAGGSWRIEFIDPGHVSEPLLTASDTNLTGHTTGTTIYEVFEGGDWDDSTSEGTVGPDGQVNPNLIGQLLTLWANATAGFDPTDGEDLGGDQLSPAATNFWPADGHNSPPEPGRPKYQTTDLLNQLLTLQVNVDTTQPCPKIFSAVPQTLRVGDAVTIRGQGLVSATFPTADAYDAEVRIYETPDFSASYITMTITGYTAGDTEDTISAQVPVGATSGYMAVVHTTTPSCSGSEFVFLNVIEQEPDLDAGWWIEVWNLRGTQRIVPDLPVRAAFFEKIKNDIGSGWVEIPAFIPDPIDPTKNVVDSIADPDGDPKVERLIRIYLDGILRYSFFSATRSEPYGEKGQQLVRIFGLGRESIINWGQIVGENIDSQDVLYGSTANVAQNGDMLQGRELVANGGFELAERDPWVNVGTSSLSVTQVEARTGAFSLQVTPAAINDGTEQEISVEGGTHNFFEAWVKDPAAAGQTIRLRAYYIDDDENEVNLDTDTVSGSALWQQLLLEFDVPTGVDQIWIEVVNTTGTAVFYLDDVTGIGTVEPWTNRDIGGAEATVTLSDDYAVSGPYSMKVVAGGDRTGARQILSVAPSTSYVVTAQVTGTLNNTVRLRAVWEGASANHEQDLPALGTFQEFTISFTTDPGQTSVILDLQSRETSSITFYVDKVVVTPGNPAASGGTVGLDLVQAAQARDVFPHLTWDFDGSRDSYGQLWADNALSLELRHGRPIGDAFDQLVAYGVDWEITDAFVLRTFNFMGFDLTALPDNVPVIAEGKPIYSGQFSGENPRHTSFFAEGQDGITTTGSRGDWETDLEKREGWITNTGANTEATLGKLIDAALDAEDSRGQAFRLSLGRDSSLRPFVHFDVGDVLWVDLPSEGIDKVAYRVVAIAVNLAGEGDQVSYLVAFNKLEYEREAKLASALSRLLARGEVSTSGDLGVGGGTVGSAAGSTGSSVVTDHDHSWSDFADASVAGDLTEQLPNPTVRGLRGIRLPQGTPQAEDYGLAYDDAVGRYRYRPLGVQTITFTANRDPLIAETGLNRWYPPYGSTIEVIGAVASVATAPTGGPIETDINRNGTTIFTTQTLRAIIATTENVGESGTPDGTVLLTHDATTKDYLTADVDLVGTTVAGARLTITVYYRYISWSG